MDKERLLFKGATKRFAKMVGGLELKPTPDLATGRKLALLDIVVKKSDNKWYRKKTRFSVKQTKLSELLLDCSDLDLDDEIEEDPKFGLCENPESKTEKTGHFGVNFWKIFNSTFHVKTSKSAKFCSGKLTARYLRKRDLHNALNNRKINIEDPEIRQMIQAGDDPILCVVTKVIRTTETVDIKEVHDLKIKSNQTVTVPMGDVVDGVSGGIRVGILKRDCPMLKIYSDTTLAYEVCELKVHMKTGEIELMMDSGLSGGFVGTSTMDGIESNTMTKSPQKYMCTLYDTMQEMTSQQRTIVRDAMTTLMTSEEDLEIISIILQQYNRYDADQDDDDSRSSRSLNESCESMSISSASEFSESSCGSNVSEPTSPDDESVKLPGQDDGLPTAGIPCPTCSKDSLSWTTRPDIYRNLLEIMGCQMKLADGSFIGPAKKDIMELFACFVESLIILNEDNGYLIKCIKDISPSSRSSLLQLYYQSLVLVPSGSSEPITDQFSSEECGDVERVWQALKDEDQKTYCVFCTLLAVS